MELWGNTGVTGGDSVPPRRMLQPAWRSTDTARMARPQTIELRGYVRELAPGRHLGVCLTLNLMVEASSQPQALHELYDLIEAYLQDAIKNDELEQFAPRRAPARFYVEYWVGRMIGQIHALQRSFKAFKDQHPLPVHG